MSRKKFVCSVAKYDKENDGFHLNTFLLKGESRNEVSEYIDENHGGQNTLKSIFRVDDLLEEVNRNVRSEGGKNNRNIYEELNEKIDETDLNNSISKIVEEFQDKLQIDLNGEEEESLSKIYYKVYEKHCRD